MIPECEVLHSTQFVAAREECFQLWGRHSCLPPPFQAALWLRLSWLGGTGDSPVQRRFPIVASWSVEQIPVPASIN